MSKIEVDTIDTQSSTTLQVGDTNTALIKIGKTGDTVEYPAGTTFTQSGTQNVTSGGVINVKSGGNITIDSGATITNNGTASGFSADLTNLNATNLTSGTVPDARFPATLPIANGSALTNLNATNLGSGTIPDARFPAALPAISGAALTNLPASGMHNLISTATISNAATAAVTGMDSTYSRYLVTINNLVPAGDGKTLYMQVIIGGSVQTGTNYPYGNNTRNSGSGSAGNESSDSTFFKISKSDIGNATGENFSGEITLYNPSETSQFKNIAWRSVYNLDNGSVDSNIGGGYYKSGQAAITGISLKMNSGNITSGVIKLYGIT